MRQLLCFAFVALITINFAHSDDHRYRLVVKFGSQCCGTDKAARQRLAEIIAMYEQRDANKIVFKKFYWGKEGEYSACFKLKELSEEQKMEFVKAVNASIHSSDIIKISENAPCDAWD